MAMHRDVRSKQYSTVCMYVWDHNPLASLNDEMTDMAVDKEKEKEKKRRAESGEFQYSCALTPKSTAASDNHNGNQPFSTPGPGPPYSLTLVKTKVSKSHDGGGQRGRGRGRWESVHVTLHRLTRFLLYLLSLPALFTPLMSSVICSHPGYNQIMLYPTRYSPNASPK